MSEDYTSESVALAVATLRDALAGPGTDIFPARPREGRDAGRPTYLWWRCGSLTRPGTSSQEQGTNQDDARRSARSADGSAATSEHGRHARGDGPKAVLHDEGCTSARAHVGRPRQGHRARGMGTVRAGRGSRPGCPARGGDLLASLSGAVPGRPAPRRGSGGRRGDRPHARTRRRLHRAGFLRRLRGARRGRPSAGSSPSPTPPAGSWPSGATRPRSPEPPTPTWRPGSAGPSARPARTAWARRSRRTARSLIRGAEHWCQAFHNWVCAGIAVRDVVTREPIAVLNISCWRSQLPGGARAGWLANAVTKTQCTLRTARPGQRRRAGRRVHPGPGPVRYGARRDGHRGQGGDRRRDGERAHGRPGLHPGGRPHGALEPRAAGTDRSRPVRHPAGGPQSRLGRLDADLHPPRRRADVDQHPARLLLRAPDREPGLVRRLGRGAAAPGRRGRASRRAAAPAGRDARQPDGAAAAAGGLLRRVGGERRVAVHRPGTAARRLAEPGQARGRAGGRRLPAGAPPLRGQPQPRPGGRARARAASCSWSWTTGRTEMVPVSRRNAPAVRRALDI